MKFHNYLNVFLRAIKSYTPFTFKAPLKKIDRYGIPAPTNLVMWSQGPPVSGKSKTFKRNKRAAVKRTSANRYVQHIAREHIRKTAKILARKKRNSLQQA